MRQTDRQTDRQIDRDRQRERERDKEGERYQLLVAKLTVFASCFRVKKECKGRKRERVKLFLLPVLDKV